MTASSRTMSFFHQWLLAIPARTPGASAIIVHLPEGQPCTKLIQGIADYLNEYDDDADGRWLPATPELVEKVTRDPSNRRLLGLQESTATDPENSAIDQLNTLGALGQRGYVVFRAPGVSDDSLQLANTFHAGVGNAWEIPGKCHVVLNPDLMGQQCIPHIIGDVFLEWLHCENSRSHPIRDIR
jgi:hypothetical protein